MMQYKWEITKSRTAIPEKYILITPKGFDRFLTLEDAEKALERSYIATKRNWDRFGWTYTITVADERVVVAEVKPSKRQTGHSINFPDDLWERIDIAAKAQDMSCSELIRMTMTKALQ